MKSPEALIKTAEKSLNKNKKIANETILRVLIHKKQYLQNKLDILNSSSYEKWLKKGFAIVKSKDGKLIKRLNNININDEINIKFFKGEANAHIKKIKNT